ncbi:hypothetical protein CYLTODRAFT_424372 [Cylindrobasidium torrendii FP15055 ss-10]|uniref:Uncharacterized protein n=1 Tax=Cylindrobasidium torrendii FP15055 ss-10 TaxID=1314674 RepID=A0A0D7B4K7_9AGAR|nr:hypothetical protein CYLTODRAFT_424372 [Cylindrobasidium torrendii FP15055 ss-10]
MQPIEGINTHNHMHFPFPPNRPTNSSSTLPNRLPWPLTDEDTPTGPLQSSEPPSITPPSLPVSPFAIRTLGLPPSSSSEWPSLSFLTCVCENCIYDADSRDQQAIQHRSRQLLDLHEKLRKFEVHTVVKPGDSAGAKKLKAGLKFDYAYYSEDLGMQEAQLDLMRTTCRVGYEGALRGMQQVNIREARGMGMTYAIAQYMERRDYSMGLYPERESDAIQRQMQEGSLNGRSGLPPTMPQFAAQPNPEWAQSTPPGPWPFQHFTDPSKVPPRTDPDDELTSFIKFFSPEIQSQLAPLARPTLPEHTVARAPSPPLGYMTEDGALIIPESEVLGNLQTIEDYVLRKGIRYLTFQGNETNESRRLIGAWCIEMEKHEVFVCSEDM